MATVPDSVIGTTLPEDSEVFAGIGEARGIRYYALDTCWLICCFALSPSLPIFLCHIVFSNSLFILTW